MVFSNFKINFLFLQKDSFYRIFSQAKNIKRERIFESTSASVHNSLFTDLLFVFLKKSFLSFFYNISK